MGASLYTELSSRTDRHTSGPLRGWLVLTRQKNLVTRSKSAVTTRSMPASRSSQPGSSQPQQDKYSDAALQLDAALREWVARLLEAALQICVRTFERLASRISGWARPVDAGVGTGVGAGVITGEGRGGTSAGVGVCTRVLDGESPPGICFDNLFQEIDFEIDSFLFGLRNLRRAFSGRLITFTELLVICGTLA
ncbi:uncharacterized protein ANIA_10427 [Aspergillus nidulans FGSC A4]|uniref:Uncharacterized protein n=1 Tax=Emericella nidulans (strain FGSC A4 / ATCC 38163 / CBS 112.46 / NRRL 194 / M139) TaxID=227321 RepID=C8V4R5_EMENI|nr:hypothetical protein [Aspergillus nidulans FGSC A4]CBF75925.1 TPA: hypothetical protein ANIA_10427 [Aspergillus nidulans FGSC A4]